MVTINGLSIDYPLANGSRNPVLAQVDLSLGTDSISAVIGPSGCGKTSLIKVIAGLKKPSAGNVLIDRTPLTAVRKNTALIFQNHGLLPWKSVFANAELPLLIAKVPAKERKARVNALLDELGLLALSKRYPQQLSGGEQQRLAIVRALASAPDLLLMDEPFSSLDALSREDAQELLLALHRERPLTIIIVTHSIEEAAYLADKIIVIHGKNPGGVKACIDNEHRRDAHFRKSPQFQSVCASLRDLLRNGEHRG